MATQDRTAWLEERRQGIGGSDVGAILNLDPWRDALQVYREKRGEVPPEDQVTPDLERGRRMEPLIAELYNEQTGRPLTQVAARVHPTYRWMRCNADRLFDAYRDKLKPIEALGVLEIKSMRVGPFDRIVRRGLPDHIQLQVQHNLGVWGWKHGAVAIHNADRWQLVHFDVPFDPELWAMLVEEERTFWHDHVEAGVPPVPAPPKIELPPLGASELVTREDPAWRTAVELMREAKELKRTAGEIEEDAKRAMKETMGGPSVVEGAGARVYWSVREGRRTFDKKLLEAANPIDRSKLVEALALAGEHDPMVNVVQLVQQLLIEGDLTVDLAAYEKVGQPYEELRFYNLREGGSNG